MSKDTQQIIDEMLRKAGTANPQILGPNGGPANGEPSQMEIIATVVQNLEMGMVQIAQAQQSIGMHLDASRLTIQLLTKMIQEKNVFTEQEFKDRYKTDVADRMAEYQKKMQQQIQQQIAEAQSQTEKQDSQCNCDTECKKCSSDTVLPSEKERSVIQFPTKKE